MAAPVPSTRSTPVGTKPDSGYQSLFSLAAPYGDLEVWEKVVTPPGFEGGEPIDTTTMHNTELITKAPQPFKEGTDMTVRVTADPQVMQRIRTLVNFETTITYHAFDGSSYAFYGYMKNFKWAGNERSKQPEADITLVQTNRDPSTKLEAGPVYTKPAGSA